CEIRSLTAILDRSRPFRRVLNAERTKQRFGFGGRSQKHRIQRLRRRGANAFRCLEAPGRYDRDWPPTAAMPARALGPRAVQPLANRGKALRGGWRLWCAGRRWDL